jgi:hypothetical protein
MPMLAPYHPFVRFGDDPEAFVAAVRAAVADGPDAAACRTLSAENSWAVRADQLIDAIEQLLASGAHAR